MNRYWHGSTEELSTGTTLLPAALLPDGGFYTVVGSWREQRVWMFADPVDVLDFMGSSVHVYEVDPVDVVAHVPTERDLDPDYGLDYGMRQQYHAASARVVRRLTGAQRLAAEAELVVRRLDETHRWHESRST